MKRYPAVIGATVAGLAGVLTFHSNTTSGSLAGALGSTSAPSASSAPPASSNKTATGGGTKGSSSKSTASGKSTSGGSSSGAASSATSTTTPKAASTGSSGPVSAIGAAAQYGYGVISVKVTVTGSKITDISVASLQTAESYSQQIANQVIPTLRGEILKAQSLKVYGISGATYTSDAYAQSVQSALTKLHFP